MVNGGDRRKDGWRNRRLVIPPCVLQDIGPLGPLPKKVRLITESIEFRENWNNRRQAKGLRKKNTKIGW